MKLSTLATVLFTMLSGCFKNETKGPVLAVGATAPAVEGTDGTGNRVALGRPDRNAYVVYFYPKDDTPGCTKEACSFRDDYSVYEKAKIDVFGVSRDDEKSHETFRAHHKLPFVLVSDESGAIQQSYGVPSKMGMPARITFLIDKDKKVVKVWEDVTPANHASDVIGAARTLGLVP